MSDHQAFEYKPFAQGVIGILNTDWTLRTLTPLSIRANMDMAVKQGDRKMKKGRGTGVVLEWENAEEKLPKKRRLESEYSHLTDFNYHFVTSDGAISPVYHIPASSIRGTLRNAAIKRLVEMGNRRAFTIRKEEDGKTDLTEMTHQMEAARKLLVEHRDGWFDILSLFGSSLDLVPGETHPLTWAGRLRLGVAIPFSTNGKPIDCVGNRISAGPGNIRRHVAVRNPLDRVSMAAKDGGLHFALEMSEGERFEIKMHILNPCRNDVHLLGLWLNDIRDGFIRFGGLTSQGRGRVEVVHERHFLFASPSSDIHSKIEKSGKPDLTKDTLLDGIWRGAECSSEELMQLF